MYKLAYAANTILVKGKENGVLITPMKLQKLLYFWYRAYYKKTGQALFAERFEPWMYGPVVETVYDTFKKYKGDPITTYMLDENGDTKYLTYQERDALSETLEEVWCRYGGLSGIKLSSITHTKGSAWYKAWMNQDQFIKDADISGEEEVFC
jgi:Uncharacterized phage-associated protein